MQVADALARLRTCHEAGLPVPADLVGNVIALLARLLSAEERRQQRDLELRRARLLLPANDAPPFTVAGQLLAEYGAMKRTRRQEEANPVRLHLRQAEVFCRIPGSQKQLASILAANDDARKSCP